MITKLWPTPFHLASFMLTTICAIYVNREFEVPFPVTLFVFVIAWAIDLIICHGLEKFFGKKNEVK